MFKNGDVEELLGILNTFKEYIFKHDSVGGLAHNTAKDASKLINSAVRSGVNEAKAYAADKGTYYFLFNILHL